MLIKPDSNVILDIYNLFNGTHYVTIVLKSGKGQCPVN